MATGEEAEKDRHSGNGVRHNGVDVLPDHGYKDYGAKDLGPIYYTGYFKSKKKEPNSRTTHC